jgi:hypothetical protein
VDKQGLVDEQEATMRFKAGLLAGLGVGYVLGTRAGRERYQQIVEALGSLRQNPGVQRLGGEVNKTVTLGKERVGQAAGQAASQAAEQAGKARETVAGAVGKATGGS